MFPVCAPVGNSLTYSSQVVAQIVSTNCFSINDDSTSYVFTEFAIADQTTIYFPTHETLFSRLDLCQAIVYAWSSVGNFSYSSRTNNDMKTIGYTPRFATARLGWKTGFNLRQYFK